MPFVKQYVDSATNKNGSPDEEYLESTIRDFGEIVFRIHEDSLSREEKKLSAITERDRYTISENADSTKRSSGGLSGVVRDVLSHYVPNIDIVFWTKYASAVGVGITVFFLVGRGEGLIITTAVLTGIQIYARRNDGRDSKTDQSRE